MIERNIDWPRLQNYQSSEIEKEKSWLSTSVSLTLLLHDGMKKPNIKLYR